jgi:signal transduction histidine kinase
MLLYEGALLGTIAVLGWIVLEIASDPFRRRRLASVGVLALSALIWSAGEMLIQHAASPAERVLARRVLFAGVCSLPTAWVWSALLAARVGASPARRLLVLLALPGAFVYSCLFWERGGLLIDWYARSPVRGTLFFAYAAWAWLLIAVGTVALLRVTPRPEGSLRLAIVAGALLPVAANVEHVLFHWTLADPTPIAFGVSALLFRWFVLDMAFASAHPPIARAEVVAQMRDGVLVADPTGRVIDWNSASEQIVGSFALEGRPVGALIAALRRQRGREIEIRTFPLERRGRRYAFGAVLVDRTELRRVELRLDTATRLEALGVLASGVAHEVNNPLAYVSVNLALLEPLIAALAQPALRDALPEELRASAREAPELIADCREGAERIQRIVEKLGQFSERGASLEAPHPHDVVRPVEKVLAMFAFGKRGRRIPMSMPEALPRALAAPDDVVNVVLHLLLNAIQMGGEDVPISIELGTTRSANEVWVRVSDEGPGIPEHDLPHVFDPFFTTRRPGPNLGLGLSMCWELARRNGGRLEVENRPEGGAAFTLILPAEPTIDEAPEARLRTSRERRREARPRADLHTSATSGDRA